MKKTCTIAAILALCCLLCPAGPVYAKPLPPNYVQLKAGGFFPQASDLDGFDTGGNVEVAIGHYVAPGFVIEGGLGYFETKGNFFLPGAFDVTEKFNVIPLTLTFKGQAFFDRFEPFAEAGIGVYLIEDDISGTVAGIPGSVSDDDTRIGLHIGLGGNYNLTRQMFVGVEGRYLWLRTDTFNVAMKLDGVVLTVNLGYRF